jgi:hypothetical protein
MPNPDAEVLQHRLHQHDDWKHLTVTSRGKTLIVVAHDGPDDPLVRLRWHDDRRQRLPVAGTVDKLVAVLRADYSSLLAAV